MHAKFRFEDGPVAATRTLIPRGDLGADSADEIRMRVDEALAAGKRRIVLDLSETTCMETAALGGLLDANARARRFDAALYAVVPPNSRVRALFAMSRLDHILTVVASRQEADDPT